MRFLLDNNVSWRVARDLRAAGHDAVHVADRGLAEEADSILVRIAANERRTILTRDSDFEPVLRHASSPRSSVILLRTNDGRPSAESKAVLDVLPLIEADLTAGAIVTLGDRDVRIRRFENSGDAPA